MKYIPRRDWGARLARGSALLPSSTVDTLVFHYTAADSDEEKDHKNCARRVRSIQNFHIDSRGWDDIAYNELVCRHGYVFEGRGFGVRSAATGVDNSHTYAICFLGDDKKNRKDITAKALQALIDITRSYGRGAGKKFKYRGHKDFMQTSCPGAELYSIIHSFGFAARVNANGPHWFWKWAKWRLTDGKKSNRPFEVPAKIPGWAWNKLRLLRRGT